MTMYHYLPYSELKLNLDSNLKIADVVLPWVVIEFSYENDIEFKLNEISLALNESHRFIQKDMDEFISMFDQPLGFVQPRDLKILDQSCNNIASIGDIQSPQMYIKNIVPAYGEKVNLSFHRWTWEINDVLNQALIQNGYYDGFSIYRSFYRLLMLGKPYHRKDAKQYIKLLDYLLNNDEELFFDILKYYIRQYHHVTSTSYNVMEPSIYTFPKFGSSLKNFIDEEKGHGNFTWAALKEIGVENIWEIPVSSSVCSAMELLRFTAQTNLLAFSMLITCFELDGEQDSDPVADLLLKSTKPLSGKPLKLHFDFNKSGAHFLTGEPFVRGMEAVSRETAIQGIRISELFLMLQGLLDRECLNYGIKLYKDKYKNLDKIAEIIA